MLKIDISQCSGCSRCEVNCSFFHTGTIGRSVSRIRVVKVEGTGIDFPVVCQQCEERYCTKCPEGAIEVGPLGQIVVSPTMCVSCGICEKLCPIGAIQLAKGIPFVCDLCGGEPRCAQECTMNAISLDAEVSGQVSLAAYKKSAKGLDTEAKRVCFAEEESRGLREQWLAGREG